MKKNQATTWPVLTTYDQKHLRRIALPIGGIGTGTISLGGRGDLRDWEIVNRPAKGFYPPGPGATSAFFALRAQPKGGKAVSVAIEGPFDKADYEAAFGATIPNHGLPKFRNCSFAAAYPFGQVMFSDATVPLKVRLEAFNPLVPGNTDASSLPVVFLRYVLTNPGSKPVDASVCGMIPNFIGVDGSNPTGTGWNTAPDFTGRLKGNRNEFKKGDGFHGIFMSSKELDPANEQWGTIAFSVLGQSDKAVSYRTAWAQRSWGDSLLDFWDDFSADGRVEERDQGTAQDPKATLAASVTVPPKSSRSVTFAITWYFPNRMTWTNAPEEKKEKKEEKKDGEKACCDSGCSCNAKKNPNWIGNYYTTLYADAWDAASKIVPRLGKLEADTVEFVSSFCASDLPAVVKEAALYNVSTLRTQTAFRTPDGLFYGWEGCGDHNGCCHGSCTHVWNYETAMGFLFGDLSRIARKIEWLRCTNAIGHTSFRVNLPIERAKEFPLAAADGQMGSIMRTYREWLLSGDDAFLREIWPMVKKGIEFCWIPGGWDGDQDGVMEGCQHNTMDVEYYGPNGQMGIWYLGALRACEEMAKAIGEKEFADRCRSLFEKGSAWIDANLFNGEFYEHQIRPVTADTKVADGIRWGGSPKEGAIPDFQLGPACLVDQLVGQYMAHVTGLGYLTEPKNVKKSLQSIMKYNFKKDFYSHFNHLRTFVLNEESAIVMATYPRGNRPLSPFPYCNEVMTGFEYTAACGMLYEGMTSDGLKSIKAIRERYNGLKRSPFDEAECGHHYARAMASWTALLALTGFQYSGVEKSMTMKAGIGTTFWSNGDAWGTCSQKKSGSGYKVELKVLHGAIELKKFELDKFGSVEFAKAKRIAGGKAEFTIRACPNTY